MLRALIVAAVVAVVLGAAPSVHAESAVQADKCLDLQDRCLHNEAVVCRAWQSECMHPRQATRRGSHGKRHGSRHRRV